MNRLLAMVFVGVISVILADAALKTALALPQILEQSEARRAQ
jgi:hypothetical protein